MFFTYRRSRLARIISIRTVAAVGAGLIITGISSLTLRALASNGAFKLFNFDSEIEFSKWLFESSTASKPLNWAAQYLGRDDVATTAPSLAIGIICIPLAFKLFGKVSATLHDRYFGGYNSDLLTRLPNIIRAFDPLRGPTAAPDGVEPYLPMPWIGYDAERRDRRRHTIKIKREATPDAETAWQLSDGESHLRQMDEHIRLRAELDAFVIGGAVPANGRKRGKPAIPFSWTFLTGRPGSGKTRLAIQLGYAFEGRTEDGQRNRARRRGVRSWLRRSILLPTEQIDCWHVGWLKPSQRTEMGISTIQQPYRDYGDGAPVPPIMAGELLAWRPSAPTLLILDDPIPSDASAVIHALAENSSHYRHPTRLLIVNQTVISDIAGRDGRHGSLGGRLAFWNESRLHRLDFDRLRGTGLLPPGEFSSDRRRRFLRVTEGNPLLCEIGLAWLREEYSRANRDGDDTLKDMTREALLTHRVERLLRGLDRAGLGQTQDLLALTVATLAGEGAPSLRAHGVPSGAPTSPRGRIEEAFSTTFDTEALRRAFPEPEDDFDLNLPRIRPEMIGDAFAARVMERVGKDARDRVVRLAFQLHPGGMQRTVLRILSATPAPNSPQKLRSSLQDPSNQPAGVLSAASVCLALAEASLLVPLDRWHAGETHRSLETETEFINALALVNADELPLVLDGLLLMLDGTPPRSVPRATLILGSVGLVFQRMRSAAGASPNLDYLVASLDRCVAAARRWCRGGSLGGDHFNIDELWHIAISKLTLNDMQIHAIENLLARVQLGAFPAKICSAVGALGRELLLRDSDREKLLGLRCELSWSRLCGNPPISQQAKTFISELDSRAPISVEERLALTTILFWKSVGSPNFLDNAIQLIESCDDIRSTRFKMRIFQFLMESMTDIDDKKSLMRSISLKYSKNQTNDEFFQVGRELLFSFFYSDPAIALDIQRLGKQGFWREALNFGINNDQNLLNRIWLYAMADSLNSDPVTISDVKTLSSIVRDLDTIAAHYAGERLTEYTRLIAWSVELRFKETQSAARSLLDFIDTVARPFSGDGEFFLVLLASRATAAHVATADDAAAVDRYVAWLDEHPLAPLCQYRPEYAESEVKLLSAAVFAHKRVINLAWKYAERSDAAARRLVGDPKRANGIADSIAEVWRYLAIEDPSLPAATQAASRSEAWGQQFPNNEGTQENIALIRRVRREAGIEPEIVPPYQSAKPDWGGIATLH